MKVIWRIQYFFSSIRCWYYDDFYGYEINDYLYKKKKAWLFKKKVFDAKFETKFNYEKNVIIKQNKSLTWKEVIVALSRRQKTEFYAPLQSFWPLFVSFSLGLFLLLLVSVLHNEKIIKFQNFFLLILVLSLSIAIAFWFTVFYLEKIQGNHNFKILDNIEMGFFLFLFTEALCFMSLFWVFLHSTLAASIHVGLFNPGEGVANFFINETIYLKKNWDEYYFSEMGTPIYYNLTSKHSVSDNKLQTGRVLKLHINFYDKGQLINPYKLPLLNTFILLSSAATLNLSHLSMKKSQFLSSLIFLFFTILLGIFFVCIQYKEYKECTLQYNDGIYAACFFSLTGLHGFHVILGLICLLICFLNIIFLNYSSNFHQSFHYSILYWHFVDIIWILVYFVIYLWPSSYFFKGDAYAAWLNVNYYSVHFDKKTFEKAVKTELFTSILNNDKKSILNLFFSNDDNCFDSKILSKERKSLSYFSVPNPEVEYDIIFDINLCTNDDYPDSRIIKKNRRTIEKFTVYLNLDLPINLDMTNCIERYQTQAFNIIKAYETEFYLQDWFDTKDYFNYNEVKKNPHAFCFVMNIMHNEIFYLVEASLLIDIKTNAKRWAVFCFIYKFSSFITLQYIYFFVPYMFEFKFIRKMFKLLEYRKV